MLRNVVPQLVGSATRRALRRQTFRLYSENSLKIDNEPHNLPESSRKSSAERKKRHKFENPNFLTKSHSELIRASEEMEDLEVKENLKKEMMGTALKTEDFEWASSMSLIRQWEKDFPLDKPCLEERQMVTAKSISESLAKLAGFSETFQKLLDLGVDLSHWERKGWTDFAISLDFEQNVKPVVLFLKDHGVKVEDMARIFTENPFIFNLDTEEDLVPRVSYLKNQLFSEKRIAMILSKDPQWLSLSEPEIDARLGYLQQTFSLSVHEVKILSSLCPELVTWEGIPNQIRFNIFALENEGFTKDHLKEMILREPAVFICKREDKLTEIVQLLHEEVGFPLDLLSKFPETLKINPEDIKFRHEFLKLLDRDQYDPKQPNYISPNGFACSSDVQFARNAGKVDASLYYEFLKTV